MKIRKSVSVREGGWESEGERRCCTKDTGRKLGDM